MRILRQAAIAGTVLLSALAVPLRAQSNFEGVIQFKGMSGDSGVMTQTTKGSMVRMDGGQNSAMQMTAILDTKTRTLTMMMVSMKRYSVNQLPSPDSVLSSADRKASVTKTGQTEVVAGVTCEIYKGSSTNSDGKVEEGQACLAKGVGLAMFQLMAGRRHAAQGSLEQVFQDLAAQGLLPLKIWAMKNGQMVSEIEAISIEKKSIPNSMFEVPADFTKMQMPAGMGMPTP
jgi:Spy/CpxP family protein refolding chaperone